MKLLDSGFSKHGLKGFAYCTDFHLFQENHNGSLSVLIKYSSLQRFILLQITSLVEVTAISISPPESVIKYMIIYSYKIGKSYRCELQINSFIWGSKVVITESTELLAFSATLARIPLPGIQPNRPPLLMGGVPPSVLPELSSLSCNTG